MQRWKKFLKIRKIELKAWADQQLPMTVSSNEAAKLYDGSLRQLVSWIDCAQLGGLEHTIKEMQAAENDFCIFKIFFFHNS